MRYLIPFIATLLQVQIVFSLKDSCQNTNADRYLVENVDCTNIRVNVKPKTNNMRGLKLEIAPNNNVQTNFLNMSFINIQWDYITIKVTDNDHPEDVAKCFQFLNKHQSDNFYYDCLEISPDDEHKSLTIEYEIASKESSGEAISKKLLFYVVNFNATENHDLEDVKMKPIFSYIEYTDSSQLLLKAQKFDENFNISDYKVEVWKEKNDRLLLKDLRFFDGTTKQEIRLDYYTNNEAGEYFFVLSVISRECPEDGCLKSSTPKLQVGSRKLRNCAVIVEKPSIHGEIQNITPLTLTFVNLSLDTSEREVIDLKRWGVQQSHLVRYHHIPMSELRLYTIKKRNGREISNLQDRKSRAPHLPRKGMTLLVGIVGASIVLPILLYLFHYMAKVYNYPAPDDIVSSKKDILIVYQPSTNKHNEAVISFITFLRHLVDVDVPVDVIPKLKIENPEKLCQDTLALATYMVYITPPLHEQVQEIDFGGAKFANDRIFNVIFEHCTEKVPAVLRTNRKFRIFKDFDQLLRIFLHKDDHTETAFFDKDLNNYRDLQRKIEEAKTETSSHTTTSTDDGVPVIVVTTDEPRENDKLLPTDGSVV